MPSKSKKQTLEIAGREVTISNPDKVYFPELGVTKLALVEYYLAVADGALRGTRGRPMNLKRFPDGIGGEPFFQKRAPEKRPAWIETSVFSFPSGRTAEEVVVNDAAQLAWVVNLGCIDLNPHPVRAVDMDHPNELRIDLDPVPGVEWAQVLAVAAVAREVLADFGLVGWPKTSGSRGVHVLVRIEPRWPFTEVRRAGLAFAREVERRAPDIATSKWWKEERHGVFLDFNQNARDRTTASAYSVRPVRDARVSMPLTWDELATCDAAAFTLSTVPPLFASRGDAHAAIDDRAFTLDSLLALADSQPPLEPSDRSALPVITIGQAKTKADALAGLERWKARHPTIAALLPPSAYLLDTNRGRSSAWYRVRINLDSVPPTQRPAEEPPDPDYDPRSEWIRGPA
jgi:bifunctional non-homologous end joining protein LigD